MQCQCRLAILIGREILCLGRGNGFVTRHDPLNQAAHGFNAQGQRDDIQQQQIAARVVARQLVGLNGRAQCDDLIGVEIGEWLAPEETGHRALDLRHARGAAHHHHAVDRVFGQLRIAQGLANRDHGPRRQARSDILENRPADSKGYRRPRQQCACRRIVGRRQSFFCSSRCNLDGSPVGRRLRLAIGLPQHPAGQCAVVIVTPQC